MPETDPTPTLIETLSAPPTAHNIDMIVRALLASKAELNKSRLELETLRSAGVPAVTVNPPLSEALHDASVDMRAALVATTSAKLHIAK